MTTKFWHALILFTLVAVSSTARSHALDDGRSGFELLPEPRRVLDTRPGGATFDGAGRLVGVVRPGATLRVEIADRAGISPDATTVLLTATVTESVARGTLILWPCARPRPADPALYYGGGRTVAGTVVTELSDGGVCLATSSPTHVIIDVVGALSQSVFRSLPEPHRLLDARPTTLAADSTTRLAVAGHGGVPSTASSVVLSIVIFEPQEPGSVTVSACGVAHPDTSTIDFGTGTTISRTIIASLSDGDVCVHGSTRAHVVVDAIGSLVGDGFTVLPVPLRVLETRLGRSTQDGLFAQTTAPPEGSTVELQVAGRVGVPTDVGGVVLNVTATGATSSGFVTVFPPATTRPNASTLHHDPGTSSSNLVVSPVGPRGEICIFTQRGVDLAVDVVGYLTGETLPVTSENTNCPTPSAITSNPDQRAALLDRSRSFQFVSFDLVARRAIVRGVSWNESRQRLLVSTPSTVPVSPQFVLLGTAGAPHIGAQTADGFGLWVIAHPPGRTRDHTFHLAFDEGVLVAAAAA